MTRFSKESLPLSPDKMSAGHPLLQHSKSNILVQNNRDRLNTTVPTRRTKPAEIRSVTPDNRDDDITRRLEEFKKSNQLAKDHLSHVMERTKSTSDQLSSKLDGPKAKGTESM